MRLKSFELLTAIVYTAGFFGLAEPAFPTAVALGLLLLTPLLLVASIAAHFRRSRPAGLLFLVLGPMGLGAFAWALWTVFPVTLYSVPTRAMEPTLFGDTYEQTAPPADAGPAAEEDGNQVRSRDYIVSNGYRYKFGEIHRGDIVTLAAGQLEHPSLDPTHTFVKRVVALPGERIDIVEGQIVINGNAMTAINGIPDIHYVPGKSGAIAKMIALPFQVPANQYFVLGDHSEASFDSRYFGPVPEEAIDGKVTKIYYPLYRTGTSLYPRPHAP